MVCQGWGQSLAYQRVQMPGHDGDHIWEGVDDLPDGGPDPSHRLAPVLAPVGRHQQHPARVIQNLT